MSVKTRTTSSSAAPRSSNRGSSDDKLDRVLNLLNLPTLTITHAKEVKDSLKSADKKWLLQFLKSKGLHLLTSQLLSFHTNPDVLVNGTRIQYELLLAVKSAMNSKVGLDIMIKDMDLISSLALNIDCSDCVVCTQTLELLAVLMVSGESGSKTVLDALDFYKLVKRERVRFQSLVDVLLSLPSTDDSNQECSRNSFNSISFKRDILFFLNTVVNTSVVLDDRLEIRADLVYAGILPAIEKLKMLCFDELVQDISDQYSPDVAKRVEELHELESQVQVFETVLQRDVAECLTDLVSTFDSSDTAPGVDLSDPEQIFQSLLASAVEHECFFPLLRVLQTLLMIPSYDVFGKKQWEVVENSLSKIVRGSQFDVDGMTGSLLEESKNILRWKQRVEDLSQQVDMLSLRCQSMEEEETVMKEELQELRSRESSLHFLRVGDTTRHLKEMEIQRQHEECRMHHSEIFSGQPSPKLHNSASDVSANSMSISNGAICDPKARCTAVEDMSKVDLQNRLSELESELRAVRSLLHDDQLENNKASLEERPSKADEPALRIAVPPRGQGSIPLAPPLPLHFHLEFASLPSAISYGLLCAPPLPSPAGVESLALNDNIQHRMLSKKPKKSVIEPRVPMRSLFWTKIPDNSIHNTIWELLSDDKISLNLVKLESQFCKTLSLVSPDGEEEKMKPEKKEKIKDISLLDSKVQQNVGIALAKFRMPSHEICRAVVQMDSSRLDLDKLISLRALAPTQDDLSVLREYDGDVDKLGKVEKFFLHVNDIPRYIPRLDCFIFMCKFQMMVSEMYHQYDIMNRALDQIENSSSFRRILEVVLALGNYLNGSTPRGGIYGFKLEGLLKLSAVKSVDNKLNLMHFLVKECKSNDEKILGVREELNMSEEASRISLESCKTDIASLKSNLKTVEEAIEAQLLDPDPDEEDRLVEVLSPFRREASTEIGKLEEELKAITKRFYKTVAHFGGEKDQHTFTGFFSLIKDFVQSFAKAYRDIEKRRILKDKLEKKRIAEEKAKKARREKKNGVSDAENLIDDVFFALKGKKADEILDSLKSVNSLHHHNAGGRRPKNSKRRIGARPKRKVGAAEEFSTDDDDVLAAMMLKLGVREVKESPKPEVGSPSAINDSDTISTKISDDGLSSDGSRGSGPSIRKIHITSEGTSRKPPPSSIETEKKPSKIASQSSRTTQLRQHIDYKGSPKAAASRTSSPRLGLKKEIGNNSPRRGTLSKYKDSSNNDNREDDELLSFLNRKKGVNK